MNDKDKELLLKDLCARLPYGLWIERKLKTCKFGAKCMLNGHDIYAIERGQYDFYKPYLFPLSSMTEEQREEIEDKLTFPNKSDGGWIEILYNNKYEIPFWFIDFCNKNHLDYRGLIEKGLAINATGLNIY